MLVLELLCHPNRWIQNHKIGYYDGIDQRIVQDSTNGILADDVANCWDLNYAIYKCYSGGSQPTEDVRKEFLDMVKKLYPNIYHVAVARVISRDYYGAVQTINDYPTFKFSMLQEVLREAHI